MIHTLLGLPIVINGFLAIRIPRQKKPIMHIVLLLGLIVFLSGLDFFRGMVSETGALFNPWVGLSKLMMSISGADFYYLCIESFKFAHKQSEIQ